MGFLSDLFSGFFSTEDKVPATPKKVTNLEKTKIRKKRKKADTTKLNTKQLKHLLDVYENKKFGVKTYPDLAKYANGKYKLDKTHLTYYSNIKQYKESLENV